jgi:uncharacterized protein YaaN involved in tellurite resistance
METKNLPSSNDPIVQIDPLPGDSLQPGEILVPQTLGEAEAAGLKDQASRLVSELSSTAGSREMAVIDNLSGLGLPEQRRAASELDLLRARIGEMMLRKDSSAQISRDLVGLRQSLNEINPHELNKPDIFRRIFGGLPFLNRLPSPAQVLEMIAVRYENVSQQVQVIETRLGEGRRMLARDNVELRMIYEQVEAQMAPLHRNIYLGELIMQELGRVLESCSDITKSEKLRAILHDVAMRVQDLRMMEHVFVQFFTSIDLTRQNNYRLAQSIERTLSLATNVVTVGLAIQAAMARQKRVLEATQKTQAFLGEMIAVNAAAIKQQTQEIGDIYNNPLIALDKVIAAHDQLVEALNIVDRLQIAGIENAQKNIAQLSALSAGLHQRALSIHSAAGASGQDLPDAPQISSSIGSNQ